MQKIIVEIGRTLGKAVLAGVGVELARLVSLHLRRRLDPKDPAAPPPEASEKKTDEPEDLKAEIQKLRAELEKLKTERADGSITPV